MDFVPIVVSRIAAPAGRIELLEWHWPEILEYSRRESELMLEMSLPPHSTDASAEFPEVAPGQRCFMGTLFVRYPGLTVHGRGEGRRSRVVRCTFSQKAARAIIPPERPVPPIDFLHALLDIRSESLRALLRLAYRELTNLSDPSVQAADALLRLAAIELGRLFAEERGTNPGGRLAPWQHRRIRERVAEGGRPTAAELAALCGISTRHLHRQFGALTGTTIAGYVENHRIEEAKTLLATTDDPIKAIGAACGFEHANSFSRAFRRSTGLSPNAYRQSGGKAPGR